MNIFHHLLSDLELFSSGYGPTTKNKSCLEKKNQRNLFMYMTLFTIYLNEIAGFQKFPVFCYIQSVLLCSLLFLLHSHIKAYIERTFVQGHIIHQPKYAHEKGMAQKCWQIRSTQSLNRLFPFLPEYGFSKIVISGVFPFGKKDEGVWWGNCKHSPKIVQATAYSHTHRG